MKFNRRQLLAGSAALALYPKETEAFWHGGGITIPIGHGWNTLPLGGPVNCNGMDLANDGTLVMRTDQGGIYRWTGTNAISSINDPTQKWVQLITTQSTASFTFGGFAGSIEFRVAPGNSNYFYAWIGTSSSNNYLCYSTNKGTTWTQTNLSDANGGPNNFGTKQYAYKMAVDPANEKIVYAAPTGGAAASIYTTFDRSLANTWPTFNAATTDGSTPFPTISGAGSLGACGIVIDPKLGTTTVNGQTVTNHIYIPIQGSDIYESVNGGTNFVSTGAATAFGGAAFTVYYAACNANGVYYASVAGSSNGIWRYVPTGVAGAGTWTKIYACDGNTTGDRIIVDPRAGYTGYLSITGGNGVGAGWTATSADTIPTDTGSHSHWTGQNGGEWPITNVQSFDVPWQKYSAGGSLSAYVEVQFAFIDQYGTCFWSGSGTWYFGGNNDPTPSGPPTYVSGAPGYTYHWAFSRGIEGAVSQDVICPPGCPYPIIASQDGGAPYRGTFTSYPNDQAFHYSESICENLEYAASDSSFIVGKATGEANYGDFSVYSTNYGADGSWTLIAGQTLVHSTGISGSVLTIDQVKTGTVLVGQKVYVDSDPTFTSLGTIQAFGTGGTTGTGQTGTYSLSGAGSFSQGGLTLRVGTTATQLWQSAVSSGLVDDGTGTHTPGNIFTVAPGSVTGGLGVAVNHAVYNGTTFIGTVDTYGSHSTTGTGADGTYYLRTNLYGGDAPTYVAAGTAFGLYNIAAQGGQAVAVDHNHWVTVADGAVYTIPAYSTNATSTSCTWALTNLPPREWMGGRGWQVGDTVRPFAVGYGSDQGKVWAAVNNAGTIELYRSDDSGATYTEIGTVAGSTINFSIYLLSVPGYTGELWLTSNYTGGPNTNVWHVTGADTGSATFTSVNVPESLCKCLTLGAPSSPGGYPTLYALFNHPTGGGTYYPTNLYKGTYPGTGSTVTWALYGPTGELISDLPISCNAVGAQSIRGDMGNYGRLYVSSNQMGYAYYNP